MSNKNRPVKIPQLVKMLEDLVVGYLADDATSAAEATDQAIRLIAKARGQTWNQTAVLLATRAGLDTQTFRPKPVVGYDENVSANDEAFDQLWRRMFGDE